MEGIWEIKPVALLPLTGPSLHFNCVVLIEAGDDADASAGA